MRVHILLVLIVSAGLLSGCETVNKGAYKLGEATGEAANTVGKITDGGADAVKGKETKQENPYGR